MRGGVCLTGHRGKVSNGSRGIRARSGAQECEAGVERHEHTHAAPPIDLGIAARSVNRNLPSAELTARALAGREGILAANGALVVRTGACTGRSPQNRFIVDEPPATETIDWNGINRPCSPALFDALLQKARALSRRAETSTCSTAMWGRSGPTSCPSAS